MQIIEVRTKADEKDFLRINAIMNASNPKYIQPMDNEVKDVFDKSKNKAFKHGEAVRWILKNDNGELIGRIAAFVTPKYFSKGDTSPAGGIGFFDCINDQAAANLLFDTAKTWLQQKGMEAMDGPINFLDRDKWWGLMVEGFDEEPMYGISFNPPYYQQLFEGYGFQNFYNQFYYSVSAQSKDGSSPLSDKYVERYTKFSSKPGYEARHIEMNKIDKYAKDFSTVYNAAWAQHGEGKEISEEQALKLFAKMKVIIDPKLVWFAYYKDEPIAMWINLPDINQYFKHFKGKFGLLEKLRFLLLKKTKPSRKINGLAFGIVPKYQALGIDAFIIYAGSLIITTEGHYDLIEMGWAGDWNPKMLGIYKSLGGKQSRRMVTYRYNFDRSKPFERHPVL